MLGYFGSITVGPLSIPKRVRPRSHPRSPSPSEVGAKKKGASSGHSFRRDPRRLNPTRVGNGRFAISQKTTDRRCVRCIVIVLLRAGHVHTLLVMSPQWCCGVVSGHVGAG